ncbi:MAG: GGDEF domain-containing protein [Rhodocyclaceae bacterium]|nr:GGDEF domain-containing protein [Rhodocyclaceae bacterium]
MQTFSFSRLWHQAWSLILVEMDSREASWLLRPKNHLSLLETRRIAIIISRVRLIAGLFAVLTPLWIALDIWAFPREIWEGLAIARVLATLAFVAIMLRPHRSNTLFDAYRTLTLLLAVPTAFFLFTYLHMARFQLHGLAEAFSVGYAYLPFVMLAGLSIFPLTMAESVAFAAPMLLAQICAGILRLPVLDWPSWIASFWLLLLIAAVSALAGLSQLAFMIVLVREAIRDTMTGCFSRHSGEEVLELQFSISARTNTPLAVAFIDIDHFKAVNDTYGHEVGDEVIRQISGAMQSHTRDSDMLIRWGGEEFLLMLPNTSQSDACIALNRLHQSGFGQRPDGSPLTASIGVAERIASGAADWPTLVERADSRMYQAKQGGRNRIVSDDQTSSCNPS